MIAVDTSALVAILQDEPGAEEIAAILDGASRPLISAATITEALIVARMRNFGAAMEDLIGGIDFEVISVTAETARRAAAAYGVWGKGVHPAGLNFGDCFAYDVAKHHACKLLFVGNDFARTDVEPALAVNR